MASTQYKIKFIDGKDAICPQPGPITDPVGVFLAKFTHYRVKEISEKGDDGTWRTLYTNGR